MTLEDQVREHADAIRVIAAKYGAHRVRLFGSIARHQEDELSDIDFLVDLEPGRSLLDLGGLQFDLEQLLGRSVDVVTENALKERVRARVLQDAIPL